MALSEEHKAALAQGRREARAIKAYLKALGGRKPGRPVTRESLEQRLERLNEKLAASDDPLKSVELVQARLDIKSALDNMESVERIDELEKGFIENAKSYSERKGLSYTAWRELGVPAAVLRAAGIPETRRR